MTEATAETTSSLMTAATMASVLTGIFDKHGRIVLNERQRLLGLLRDHAPTQARGIRVLMSVYDENVPQNFLTLDAPPSTLALSAAVDAVIGNTGLQPELAKWAVDVWATALPASAAPAPAPTSIDAPSPAPAGAVAAPATAPTTPVVATSATPPLPDDDLVWDASVPVTTGAARPAAAAAPVAAPSYALAPSYTPAPSAAPVAPQATQAQPLPTMPTPPAETATKGFFGRWKLSHVVTGVVCLAAIGLLREYLEGMSTQTTPVASTPATPAPPSAPPPPHTPAPKPSAAQPQLIVLSTDSDPAKWPVFEPGKPVKDIDKSFVFVFNLRHPNGHIYTYRPSVAFTANARQGQGVMIAVDQANNTQEMVSETPVTTITREIVGDNKSYTVKFVANSWTKNPSSVPSICLFFTSGTLFNKFEPDHASFCASEFKNNACNVSLGCGRLQ